MNLILKDIRQKALWMYEAQGAREIFRVIMSDGTSAMFYFRLASAFSNNRWSLIFALILRRLNLILNGIVVGRGASIGGGFVIMHSVGVVINGKAVLGQCCVVQSGVVIGSVEKKSPIIGDRVHFGAGCKVLGGVKIGNDVKIGANAVVVSDVPSGATIVGIPAKMVRLHGKRV